LGRAASPPSSRLPPPRPSPSTLPSLRRSPPTRQSPPPLFRTPRPASHERPRHCRATCLTFHLEQKERLETFSWHERPRHHRLGRRRRARRDRLCLRYDDRRRLESCCRRCLGRHHRCRTSGLATAVSAVAAAPIATASAAVSLNASAVAAAEPVTESRAHHSAQQILRRDQWPSRAVQDQTRVVRSSLPMSCIGGCAPLTESRAPHAVSRHRPLEAARGEPRALRSTLLPGRFRP